MERETDINRFAHLLKPIRDLADNWNIDIARYLEEYLAEIEAVTVSFDGGTNVMNFAEAALVIQGSACVYSKKVEHLYTLVYQTLNMISSKQREGLAPSVDAHGHDADVSAAQEGDGQRFLVLDDIKEAKNIDMIEHAGKGHNVTLLPRTPLALIPLQDAEKQSSTLRSQTGEVLGKKQDYKMNAGSVHSSGALLLEPMSRFFPNNGGKPSLPGKLATIPPFQLDTPAAAANNAASMAQDDIPMMDVSDGYHSDGGGDAVTQTTPYATRKSSRRAAMMQKDSITMDYPLRLLDAHVASSIEDKPYKKGNTTRRPTTLQAKGRKARVTKETSQLEPLAEFLLHAFYSNCAQFPRQLLKKPLYPEFEVQYWAHQARMKDIQKKETQKLRSLQKEGVAEELQRAAQWDELEDDGGCIQFGDIPEDDDHGDYNEGDGYHGDVDLKIDDAISSRDAVEAAACNEPPVISDNLRVTQSYEDIVSTYVENSLRMAMAYAVRTDLSRRVKCWEERIRPILEEEESQPSFDIHKYGGAILEEFGHGTSERLSFNDIVHDKDTREVSRMFLASLQLANTNNIEVSTDKGEDNGETVVWMKLLSRQRAHEAMEEFLAPSLQKTMPGLRPD